MEIQKQSPRSVHRKTVVPKSQVCNFIKKESLPQVFSCEFCKFLRAPFLTENLRWLLLEINSLNYLTALFLSCHGVINNENVQRAVFRLYNGKVQVDTEFFTMLNKCSKLFIISMLTPGLHLFHHSSVFM